MLSIVIVNYNTRDDLRACLQSLEASLYSAEVIVIDNASTDGSAEMVEREFPDVRLLAPGRNTWYAGGNNLGMAAAQGEYVLLLNPDTIVQPNSVGTMMEFLETHPDYTGATMQLRYADGAIQRTCSRRVTYRYLLLTHTLLTYLLPRQRRAVETEHWYGDWRRDTDHDVETMPGSCTLMRRADLRYNDDLLLYFPEDDLALHLADRKFRFLAASHIIHREKSATRSWNALRIYYRDLFIFSRLHFGRAATAVLWLLSRPLVWGMAVRWWLRPPSAQLSRRES